VLLALADKPESEQWKIGSHSSVCWLSRQHLFPILQTRGDLNADCEADNQSTSSIVAGTKPRRLSSLESRSVPGLAAVIADEDRVGTERSEVSILSLAPRYSPKARPSLWNLRSLDRVS
jgi:hypothetical protein